MQIQETDYFDPIQLNEMEQVKLMNRTDTKYWFHITHLEQILQTIRNNYFFCLLLFIFKGTRWNSHDYNHSPLCENLSPGRFILQINGESKLPYTTTYYDSSHNSMFAEHHNGKLNRYKVRRRTYVSSEISFLEVKFKSNKGRTIKKRIPAECGNVIFTSHETEFLNNHITFNASDLQPSLLNSFSRLTLVIKNFKERCTIDLNLHFSHAGAFIPLKKLVIVEIKSEGKSNNSPLALAFRDQGIKATGFSKYCVGCTLTNSDLKRNAFKSKIRSIEKTIQTKGKLYKN